MPAKAADLLARFAALDGFLHDHQHLWRPRPFTQLNVPWEAQHPELAQWLRQRSLQDAEASHNSPQHLSAPAPFPELAATSRALSAVPRLPTQALTCANPRLQVDVPGRKWQQIEAFAQSLTFAQLAVSPCCYNRIGGSHYQALSTAAKASSLRLSLEDLSLPMSETVTAGTRVRRQRDESMARRLGFDLWQRQRRQCDEYLSTPSLPSTWLNKPFAEYCTDLAALKNLSTSGDEDWYALQAAGWERLAQVRNLELVRGLFRRPLELWLVLDRALYLEEKGYEVQVGEFCDSHLTPRNLMLLAQRCG